MENTIEDLRVSLQDAANHLEERVAAMKRGEVSDDELIELIEVSQQYSEFRQEVIDVLEPKVAAHLQRLNMPDLCEFLPSVVF